MANIMLSVSEEAIERLKQLALDYGFTIPVGPRAGEGSISGLVEAIGTGMLRLTASEGPLNRVEGRLFQQITQVRGAQKMLERLTDELDERVESVESQTARLAERVQWLERQWRREGDRPSDQLFLTRTVT